VLVVDKEIVMNGSIRLIVGLLITYGAVGTVDYDPSASVLLQTAIAAFGLLIMYSGVRAMNRGLK
jgi:hypothetical protein